MTNFEAFKKIFEHPDTVWEYTAGMYVGRLAGNQITWAPQVYMLELTVLRPTYDMVKLTNEAQRRLDERVNNQPFVSPSLEEYGHEEG